jgi:hypothetical protein
MLPTKTNLKIGYKSSSGRSMADGMRALRSQISDLGGGAGGGEVKESERGAHASNSRSPSTLPRVSVIMRALSNLQRHDLALLFTRSDCITGRLAYG